ncbi:MAG: DUF1643 domain-containing protein [Candidatus Dormibacteria bacterium]
MFSPDRRYRYLLTRRWGTGSAPLFLMLNPSTADEGRDDPTIRRCGNLASAWGFGGMAVANLFAICGPEPRVLLRASDPVGPDNDTWLERALMRAALVVAAWGSGVPWLRQRRLLALTAVLPQLVRRLWCLGTTSTGSPRHPLYVPRGVRPRPYVLSPP